MSWSSDPKNIIVEFLRTNLIDPRSRAESTETDTFSGTGASQTLTLTPSSGKAYAITGITVDGSSINKWQDYTIDLQNQKIYGTFASGTSNIIVTFKKGTSNWIYPSLAKTSSLSSTSYPRINVLLVGSSGTRMGMEGSSPAPINETMHFQVDIWVKEDYYYNDGTNIWSGDGLAMYLARRIVIAFEDNISQLYPNLFDFNLLNIRDAVWEKDAEIYHVILEFEIDGTSVGG